MCRYDGNSSRYDSVKQSPLLVGPRLFGHADFEPIVRHSFRPGGGLGPARVRHARPQTVLARGQPEHRESCARLNGRAVSDAVMIILLLLRWNVSTRRERRSAHCANADDDDDNIIITGALISVGPTFVFIARDAVRNRTRYNAWKGTWTKCVHDRQTRRRASVPLPRDRFSFRRVNKSYDVLRARVTKY